jgi:hypothetical protein
LRYSPNDPTFFTKKEEGESVHSTKHPFGEIFIGMIYCRHRTTPIIILISLVTTTTSERARGGSEALQK